MDENVKEMWYNNKDAISSVAKNSTVLDLRVLKGNLELYPREKKANTALLKVKTDSGRQFALEIYKIWDNNVKPSVRKDGRQ